LTAADLQAGNANKTASTSPAITVVVGPARRLAIQFPPSALGTAGVPFAAQPAIRVVDGGGNLVTTDNGRVITVARSAGTAGLQGTLTATTVNGVATFANLSYNKAETIALNFTAAGLTNIATGNILISPGPFAKLQLLVPGESAAPATASGKTGTPIAQVVDAPFTVIARSVDAYWNLVNSGTDLLGITSSDTNATLPASAALTAGVQNFSVRLNTTGSRTVTATDLTDGSKSPNTSPVITVNAAQYTPATGGSAISADTVGGAWTTLTGPVYTEKASGNVGLGTIILNAPDGFVFDTAGTNPAVLLTRVSGKGKNHLNINGMATGAVLPLTSVSGSQLVLTVTNSSSAGVICRLTWRNIRVRPSAGTPLALGYLTRSGTASVAGLSTNSYLGTLREVPGAASRLVFVTQPGNGVEGELLVPQPVIRACDQFGNASSAGLGATRSLTITLSAGSGPLLGTTGFNIGTAAGNGLATCTDLRINATGSDMQLTASASNLVSAVSSTFNVGAKSAAGTASATTGDVNSGAPSSSIGQPAILTSIQLVKGGVRITLTGPSGRTWQVQRAGSVADHDATWENIGSATTDDSGAAEFLDKHPFAGQGFYRAVQP
jgi:hypothetical protein